MDRDPSQPLSPDAAKEKLREAARKASPLGYVAEHPMQSLAAALLAGFITGRLRLPRTLGFTLAGELAPLLLRGMRKKR